MSIRMLSGVVLRTQSDDRLVELAAEGSEAAFEAIVNRYRRQLHLYCRRLLLSEHRSEDAVQQSLVNAWEALQTGTEVRRLQPWLYRITHNQAMAQLRSPELNFDQLSESLCGLGAPDSDLDRRTLMRATLSAVAALPDRQREAILRTAVDGQSHEQVALALGLTDTAVRGLVHRARTSLRTAVAVVAPTPLVGWAAGTGRSGGDAAQWLSELLAGGGSAGGAVVALKGATVLAASAVVAGGAVTGALGGHVSQPAARHARDHSNTGRALIAARRSAEASTGGVAFASTRYRTLHTVLPSDSSAVSGRVRAPSEHSGRSAHQSSSNRETRAASRAFPLLAQPRVPAPTSGSTSTAASGTRVGGSTAAPGGVGAPPGFWQPQPQQHSGAGNGSFGASGPGAMSANGGAGAPAQGRGTYTGAAVPPNGGGSAGGAGGTPDNFARPSAPGPTDASSSERPSAPLKDH